MAGAGIGGDPNQGTQHLVIGQNLVVAVNGIANAINSKFPDWVTAPASSGASGVAGQVAYDATHFYVCYQANAWLRFNGSASF
jgi:hypothetical protein